jgi:hypothetical protein
MKWINLCFVFETQKSKRNIIALLINGIVSIWNSMIDFFIIQHIYVIWKRKQSVEIFCKAMHLWIDHFSALDTDLSFGIFTIVPELLELFSFLPLIIT